MCRVAWSALRASKTNIAWRPAPLGLVSATLRGVEAESASAAGRRGRARSSAVHQAILRSTLELLDEQGVDFALMLPTLASLIEERMRDDPALIHIVVHALNEWLHEEWGFRYQDRIFTAFNRLHPDAGEGEGVGLVLVRLMVERHRGKIWLESNAGVGTTFFVALPAGPIQGAQFSLGHKFAEQHSV